MQSKISKYTVTYFNEQEFHSLKREIFTNNSYYFESTNPNPLILDIGAYIGLSIIYFKQLYPNSQIIAFEPNSVAFKILEENIFNNNLKDIELHNTAIHKKDGFKEMYIDNTGMDRYSVASFNKDAWNREVQSDKIEVKIERLHKYLNKDIDLLKLDVEGSEQAILKDIAKYFNRIKNIILEYHPTPNQNIDNILKLLNKKYDIEIFEEGKQINKNIPNDKLLTVKATYKH
jgi:FkbM family methyltransferase